MHKHLHDHFNLALCYPSRSYLVLIYIVKFSTFYNLLSLHMLRYANLTCCLLCLFMDPCGCECVNVCAGLCVRVHVTFVYLDDLWGRHEEQSKTFRHWE